MADQTILQFQVQSLPAVRKGMTKTATDPAMHTLRNVFCDVYGVSAM